MSWLASLAAHAPVPVFAALGEGGEAMVAPLALSEEISLEASVRHAAVLLVAGRVRDRDRGAIAKLHDQMPHPRSTLWWGAEPSEQATDPKCVASHQEGLRTLRRLHRDMLSSAITSEPDWQPDEPPHPWRGLNENGQGGKGMMGGTPYGRPMAMTAADLRDGLELDEVTITLGPFLPTLPAGLVLELTLQGDVIQRAKVIATAYPSAAGPHEPLRRAARLLELLELKPLAERCRRAALAPPGQALVRRVTRAGGFLAIPPGLGRWAGQDVRDRLSLALGGPERAADDGEQPMLIDLLPGLEWQEAMLVINSFDTATLAQIAPVTPEEKDEGTDEDEEDVKSSDEAHSDKQHEKPPE